MHPPDQNPKTRYGLARAALHLVPPVALIHEAGVMEHGADKYGPFNWREKDVSASVYYAAALRHLLAWYDGEDRDPDSGHPHLAHIRACMAILLDAEAAGKLKDDRPPAGQAAALIRDTTRAGDASAEALGRMADRVQPFSDPAPRRHGVPAGEATCPACGGAGLEVQSGAPCLRCNGSGRIKANASR